MKTIAVLTSKNKYFNSDNYPGFNFITITNFDDVDKIDENVDGIVNQWDRFVEIHSQLVDKFHLPGPSSKATMMFRDKSKMHQLMVANGISNYRPKAIISDLENLESNLENSNFPVIVKPFMGARSRGVFLLQNKKDIKEVVKSLKQHFANEATIQVSKLKDKKILIEEYIRGKQISPICYVDQHGKVIMLACVDILTAQELKLSHMQLIYRTTPTKYSEYIKQKMHFLLQKLVTVSGLKSTFLHPEFIIKDNHPYLIELNVRLGGFRYELAKLAFGFDLLKMAIQLSLGEKVDDQIAHAGSATLCEVWTEKSGVLKKIEFPHNKHIMYQHQFLFEGDSYIAPPTGNKSIARIFVSSPNNDSLKIAKKVRDHTIIEYD